MKTMKLRESESITTNCPFCLKQFSAGVTEDDEQVVMHALPMCKMFNSLDPVEFLSKVNEKLGLK